MWFTIWKIVEQTLVVIYAIKNIIIEVSTNKLRNLPTYTIKLIN